MKITTLHVGPIETNCYIFSVGSEAVVIDPGGDADIIINELNQMPAKLSLILNTHGHYDHILANNEIADFGKKNVFIHPDDEYLLTEKSGMLMGVALRKDYISEPLKDEQELELDGEKIKVLHTPGHSQGSVSFLVAGNLFCGDLLFRQSIGRTDLEGSSLEAMTESLKKITRLKKETKVYPGHGPETTIGAELADNPYLEKVRL